MNKSETAPTLKDNIRITMKVDIVHLRLIHLKDKKLFVLGNPIKHVRNKLINENNKW